MIQEKLVEDKNIGLDQIVTCRFDSLEYEGFTAKQVLQNLKEQLSSKRTYFFLDEVQEIEGWEKVVNDLYTDSNVDIYFTCNDTTTTSTDTPSLLAALPIFTN